LSDHDVGNFFEKNILNLLARVDPAALAGHLLTVLVDGEKHQAVLNQLLHFVERFLVEHEIELRETIRKGLPWYIPSFIHNGVYERLLVETRTMLGAVNTDPQHYLRRKFHETVVQLISDLRSSPIHQERARKFVDELVRNEQVRRYIAEVARDLQRMFAKDLSGSPSVIEGIMKESLQFFGATLAQDQQLQERFNALLCDIIDEFIVRRSDDIRDLIADTVRSWDSQTIVDKIELQIGQDLQFIRMNGTLVGGVVGVLLHAVEQWLR